jgi:hypothetical protein
LQGESASRKRVLSIDTKWPFREIVPDVALKLRIEYAGAIYHVMNRGDRREPSFRDDGDRARFLETLGQACRGTDWRVHAWCLMLNHSAPGDDDDVTMDRGSGWRPAPTWRTGFTIRRPRFVSILRTDPFSRRRLLATIAKRCIVPTRARPRSKCLLWKVTNDKLRMVASFDCSRIPGRIGPAISVRAWVNSASVRYRSKNELKRLGRMNFLTF